MFVLSVAMSAAAVVLLLLVGGSLTTPAIDPSNAYLAAASVIASFVGARIVSRRSGNAVGWLLLLVGLFGALEGVAYYYGAWAYLLGHDPTLGAWAGWVAEWAWAPQFLLLPGLLPLIFPNGRLLSPRWFPAVVSCIGLIVVAFVVSSTASQYLIGSHLLPNPFPWRLGFTLGNASQPAVVPIALVGFGAQFLIAAAALAYRWRRSDALVRAQLKWFLYGISVLVVAVLIGLIPGILALPPPATGPEAIANSLLNQLQALAFGFVVIAVGIAVFRYRLYDIDLIINRTLVYVSLTAILAGVYAGAVALSQRAFVAVTGQKSDTAVVLTAFAVGALFSPLRDALQRIVNRRVISGNPNATLDDMTETVDSVIAVLQGETMALRVVRAAVKGYGAEFGALYLEEHGVERMIHREGTTQGSAAIEVPIEAEDRRLGRLVLGKRGASGYSRRDYETLRRSADAIARALVFAERDGSLRAAAPAR